MGSVEVLPGRERRRWSEEQKRAVVAAAFEPGAVVRDVARQADVTPSLIYRWRRDRQAIANGFARVLVENRKRQMARHAMLQARAAQATARGELPEDPRSAAYFWSASSQMIRPGSRKS